VSTDVTLARLHEILQVLMGWNNQHLYAFVVDGKRYSPRQEDDGDVGNANLIQTRLSSLSINQASVFTYEYDFGDRWEIELYMESTVDMMGQKLSAECLEGCRHGPVEDSGGSRGYMEKIRIFRNPQHRAYQQTREWIGPKFDPEAFSLTETNVLLKAMG
jgi:hypothetical protein